MGHILRIVLAVAAAALVGAADATRTLAERETPCWPGLVVAARVAAAQQAEGAGAGESSTSGAPGGGPLGFEIAARPGETVRLDLAVWNVYRHKVTGEVEPRLPEGWTAEPTGGAFALDDGGRETFRFRVTVPPDAEAKTYEVGAHGWFADRGRTVTEMHAGRVRVEK